MEANNNDRSYTRATNCKRIGGSVEKMFLSRNRNTEEAGIRDGMEIGKAFIRDEVKSIKFGERIRPF